MKTKKVMVGGTEDVQISHEDFCILPRVLKSHKNLHFNEIFGTKVNNIWLKSTEELSFVTLKSGAKFKEKLTCVSKN